MLASSSRLTLRELQPARLAVRTCRRRHFATESSAFRAPASALSAEDLRAGKHLRSKPWSHTNDTTTQSTYQRGTLAQYNLDMSKNQERTHMVFQIASRMKAEGVTPNVMTYLTMLSACAKRAMDQEAWAVIEDMELVGLSPDIQCWNLLLQATRAESSESVWKVLQQMGTQGVKPDAATYSLIIQRFTDGNNLEMALQNLYAMNDQMLNPQVPAIEAIITLAADLGHARLAIDLAMAFESGSIRQLSSPIWMHCLIASSNALYVEGVQLCWKKVTDLNILPDAGTLLQVLHTAGRHGLPDLATDALKVLKTIGEPWQEYHFAPVIEAFCRSKPHPESIIPTTATKGQTATEPLAPLPTSGIKDAFLTLALMHSSNIPTRIGTTSPIFDLISQSTEALDDAWGILDDLFQSGSIKIDTLMMNCVVNAAVALGDLQRAVGAYKAFPGYDIKPNLTTYTLLLQGCVAARHRELGDKLLLEMKEHRLKADINIYTQMMLLCIAQEDNYEDAFFYLEETKAANFIPKIEVYEALIRRCLAQRDGRWSLVQVEMDECGYQINSALRQKIQQSQRANEEGKGTDLSSLSAFVDEVAPLARE